MRYTIQVQYIGKNYAGSQIQLGQEDKPDKYGKTIKTIQGELEKALSTLIKINNSEQAADERQQSNEKVNYASESELDERHTAHHSLLTNRFKTVFSGRTDAGVNALGQVVHFNSPQLITSSQTNIGASGEKNKNLVASEFLYSLNEILPSDISVSDLQEVNSNFHAQKSAKLRHYRYEFINRKCKNAFDGDLMRVKFDIDLERMQNSLNYLLGEHDFSSFKSSGTLNPSKVCFIEKAEVRRETLFDQGDKIVIDIMGNRFLYNMVRTIVGTLLDIEGQNLKAQHMIEVLESKDRSKAGRNVSPYGLTLMKVIY